ncbi:hypothetical protein KIN20_016128 [Parelaphostrongylus tenuis]|uniref:Uncharacterized protein n=1 Tax=Parelaphostrongylus tenuis TaxID=148309 RepID=A0AAD5QMR5_PARTN|nr:hypothetical protein KIN20_016128 [Parelaphostrongylus tenuis]
MDPLFEHVVDIVARKKLVKASDIRKEEVTDSRKRGNEPPNTSGQLFICTGKA